MYSIVTVTFFVTLICYLLYLVTPQNLIAIYNILSLSPTPQCHGTNPLYRIVHFPFGLELPAKP